MSTAVELIILFGLILLNGLLAMTEIAVVSAKKPRLQNKAQQGSIAAKRALHLIEQPNRLLATIQLGISLIGILAGAFGSASFAGEIADILAPIAVLDGYYEYLSYALVVVGITYLSLLFGELVPKRIGLNNAERIAMWMAGIMLILSRLTTPAVSFLSMSTNLVIRVLRVPANTAPPITEDELHLLVAEGTHVGIFDPVEQNLVLQVFKLDEYRVTELMTQRPNIVWINQDDDLADINQVLHDSGFSYFPVYQNDMTNAVGMISAKKLWGQIILGNEIDWPNLMSSILFVPEHTTALQMLDLFRTEKQRVALVIDEYAAIQGLISQSDILQAIVGDILPLQEEQAQVFQRDENSWLVDAMMTVEAFEEEFGVASLPYDKKDDFHTLAGFVLAHLDRIPNEGDVFNANGMQFEIIDMDGHRIDKLLVTRLPKSLSDSSADVSRKK